MFTGTHYGSYLKLLVTAIVDNCPNLSVYSVASDTTSKYDVTLKWSASDTVLLKIYNSSETMYVQWVYASSGTIVKGTSSSSTITFGSLAIDGVTQYVADAYVTVSQIGDFLNTVAIYGNNQSSYLYINFNWARSTALNKKVFFLDVNTGRGYTKPTYSQVTLPTSYTILEGDNTMYSSEISGAISDVGYFPNNSNYYLRPTFTYGLLRTVNLSLGNLLWGGLYDLYILYSKSGSYVPTIVDGYYVVNGDTYRGCSTALYIPEPSIYLK